MGNKVHACKTCGKVSLDHAHLCDPESIKEAYVCGDCGKTTKEPTQICKPQLKKLNFSCSSCSKFCSAFSTRDMTSPMPRIRETIRSG